MTESGKISPLDELHNFVGRVIRDYFPERTPFLTEEVILGLMQDRKTAKEIARDLNVRIEKVKMLAAKGLSALVDSLHDELDPASTRSSLSAAERRKYRVLLLAYHSQPALRAINVPVTDSEFTEARRVRYELGLDSTDDAVNDPQEYSPALQSNFEASLYSPRIRSAIRPRFRYEYDK